MVSHWSLSDSKSLQVYRTLLSILADLNNAVVWQSSSPSISPLVSVLRVPITIGITIIFMFHCFISSLQGPGTYLSFYFLSILFYGQPRQQNPLFSKFSFSCWWLLGLVIWPRLGDPFIYQNPRRVNASHFLGQILVCAYTICLYSQISVPCTIPNGSPCPPSCI